MNKLFYGDNLAVLRESIATESVDLIYLDPPFNSKATYNVLFKAPSGEQSQAQIEVFEDAWHWNIHAEEAFDETMRSGNTEAAELLRSMRAFLGENDMMAYLAMMAIRLIELHRALKPSGSLYLHCDPVASHYLKILMDAIFGPTNYLNEIVWRRTGSHNSAKRFGPIHDVVHFYQKSNAYKHRTVFRPYLKGHIDDYFKKSDDNGRYWTNSIHGSGIRHGESGKPWRSYDPSANGRHWAIPSDLVEALGVDPDLPPLEKLDALADLNVVDFPPGGSKSLPTYRQYLKRSRGMPLQDIWAYQPHTRGVLYNSNQAIDEDVRWLQAQGDPERLGYQTQKPIGLLTRIIESSSGTGDLVLDPFCGCGTTVHAAQKLNRKWIGIDITHLAIGLIERRLKDAFSGIQFQVEGTPKDFAGAEDLAQRDKYQFQWWAVTLINAVPYGGKKKGADTGIDGFYYCKPDGKKTEAGVISVKGGDNVTVAMVRDLKGVLEREKSPFAVMVTLREPTSPMIKEAAAAGFFNTPFGRFPRMQIVSVASLLNGKIPKLPPQERGSGFKKAERETPEEQLI